MINDIFIRKYYTNNFKDKRVEVLRMATHEENTIVNPMEAEAYKMREYPTFDEMGLNDNLLRGIMAYGYEKPSPIQSKAIVPLMEGHEVVAQAQSGTGKTGAFCIGALSRIDPAIRAPQVLVLSHTRELSLQTTNVARGISQYMGISVHCATGGPPVSDDIRALENGVHMLIGCPGRVSDLITRKKLNPAFIKLVILDEADHMLKDRFYDQVVQILASGLSKEVKISLFSATMPVQVNNFVRDVIESSGNKTIKITREHDQVTLDGISQFFVKIRDEDKFNVLIDIYEQLPIHQLFIFVNTRRHAEWLASKMQEFGHTLQFIHADMDDTERKRRMKDFRDGSCKVLISTDLLARGIDVQHVNLVINFQMPLNREDYIHRIGRSGRFGRKGTIINIVNEAELECVRDIERAYATTIKEFQIEDLETLKRG